MATLRAAPTKGTITLNNSVEYLPTQYLPRPIPQGPQGGGRDGKTKAQTGTQQQAIATTLCEEMQASHCVYKSRGAPARGNGPPQI